MNTVVRPADFTQVCVWPGTVLGDTSIDEFVKGMQEMFGVRVLYLEEVQTLPDVEDGKLVEGTGGRNDLIFAVHNNDIGKFAVSRLQAGIRWVEDVMGDWNTTATIYPEHINEYYSWEKVA